MAFERIKTVGGRKYKYLVENYRQNGKVKQRTLKNLGRLDKTELKLPYGLYYFTQDGCGACMSKEEVINFFKQFQRILDIEFMDVQYINLSYERPAINITVTSTPTLIEISEKGFFVCDQLFAWFGSAYLVWKVGVDKAKYVLDTMAKENEQKEIDARNELKDEIIRKIEQGIKYRELYRQYQDRKLIKECQSIVNEKATCVNGVCRISSK